METALDSELESTLAHLGTFLSNPSMDNAVLLLNALVDEAEGVAREILDKIGVGIVSAIKKGAETELADAFGDAAAAEATVRSVVTCFELIGERWEFEREFSGLATLQEISRRYLDVIATNGVVGDVWQAEPVADFTNAKKVEQYLGLRMCESILNDCRTDWNLLELMKELAVGFVYAPETHGASAVGPGVSLANELMQEIRWWLYSGELEYIRERALQVTQWFQEGYATEDAGARTIASLCSVVTPAEADLRGEVCDAPDGDLSWGSTFTFEGQVRNQGSEAAGSFVQKVYLSGDHEWGDEDDYYLGSYEHASLAGNTVGPAFSVDLTLPAGPPHADYIGVVHYVGMVTDADSSVGESDETNNGPEDYSKTVDWDTISVNIPRVTIDAIAPGSGVTGSTVTVSGSNFGSEIGEVLFGSVSTPEVTSWSETTIQCLVPDVNVTTAVPGDGFEDGSINSSLWVVGGGGRGWQASDPLGAGEWEYSHAETASRDGYLEARVWGPLSGSGLTYGAEAWIRTTRNFNDGQSYTINFTWGATATEDHYNLYLIQITDGYIPETGDLHWPTREEPEGTVNLLWGSETQRGMYLPSGQAKTSWSITLSPDGTARLYDAFDAGGSLMYEAGLDASKPWYVRLMISDGTSSGFPAGDMSLRLYDFGAVGVRVVRNDGIAGNSVPFTIVTAPLWVPHDWNGDGFVSIVGDVPPFVDCVYFSDCPDLPEAQLLQVGDCNGDDILSIIGDVPCFVDCVYFGNCSE